jgi:hypothetical protein
MTKRLISRRVPHPWQASKDPLTRLRQYARAPVMPVSLAQALSVHLADQKRLNKSRRTRLQAAWEMAVEQTHGLSAEAAKRAEVRAMANTGEVQVTVDSPALAHELGVVYRAALLKSLRELLAGTVSIAGLRVKTKRRI